MGCCDGRLHLSHTRWRESRQHVHEVPPTELNPDARSPFFGGLLESDAEKVDSAPSS